MKRTTTPLTHEEKKTKNNRNDHGAKLENGEDKLRRSTCTFVTFLTTVIKRRQLA